MSAYGERLAHELGGDLARAGAVVVSGLAPGIDCAAHAGALAAGGATVAVLGEGLTAFAASVRGRRRRLAAALRERGALLSPYEPVLPARGWMFVRRNALIAALAEAVVIVEAPLGSGALITAADALRLGRPLFSVPGPVGARTSEGSNALLAAGTARACTGAAVVAAALGLTVARAAALSAVDPLLEALAGGPLDLDALTRRAAVPRDTVRARLVRLVLAGSVEALADGRYARR
jgi:DNA processing protein